MGAILAQTTQAVPAPAALRSVALTRAEAEMMVRVVESITSFGAAFPVEYLSYCPEDRWLAVREHAGQGINLIEKQLSDKTAQQIFVPVDSVTAILDWEECISGARDKRLSAGKIALIVAAAGVFAQSFLGLTYVATPAYIAALAISLGKPLVESQDVPTEPFKPSMLGCTIPQPRIRLGDHSDKAKVIERVIVPSSRKVHEYHWGTVTPPTVCSGRSSMCLSRGEWRVRIEGWGGERITLKEGWSIVPNDHCVTARNEICVWQPGTLQPRDTGFGPIPLYSGHEETFWVEYTGPFTEGSSRRAGPFG